MEMNHVLVVEDDKEIREGVEIYLKSQGYEVFQAADGIEGLEVIEKEEIHLAIVDIMMPRMDGIRMTMKLREKYDFPVIMLSAKSEEVDKIMGLNIGADDYVTKPFTPMELLARVNSQLRRYRMFAEKLRDREENQNIHVIGGLELNEATVEVSVDGEPVRLTVRAGDQRAEVTGPVPETARNRALTAEELQARMKKTGGTAFRCREVRVTLEEGLMLSAGAVNALRREGLAALEDTLCAVPERRIAQPEPLPDAPVEPAQPLLTCSLQKPEQLKQALADCRPEMIYLPVEWLDTLDVTPYLDRTSFCAVLPRIFRTEDEAVLREMLVRHRQVLAAVAVGNLGHLPIAEGLELPLRGDLGMNVFNSRALLFLRELGLSTAAVSFELRHQQIRDLKKYLPCEAVVYGRLPLMLMENCVIANSLGCCDVGSDYRKRSAACRCTGENVLTDRTGARFPLMPAWGHRNELENSRTLFLADKPEWRRLGLTYARLRFTTESPAECVAALQRYQGQGDYIPVDLTRGLFYRGVE